MTIQERLRDTTRRYNERDRHEAAAEIDRLLAALKASDEALLHVARLADVDRMTNSSDMALVLVMSRHKEAIAAARSRAEKEQKTPASKPAGSEQP